MWASKQEFLNHWLPFRRDYFLCNVNFLPKSGEGGGPHVFMQLKFICFESEMTEDFGGGDT